MMKGEHNYSREIWRESILGILSVVSQVTEMCVKITLQMCKLLNT
jgi:hypothetical protein